MFYDGIRVMNEKLGVYVSFGSKAGKKKSGVELHDKLCAPVA